jgi:hypothetical protein
MISKQQLDKLTFAEIENQDNLWQNHKDVVIEGKEKTALLFEEQWYLIPVNFKFGDDTHPGQPFLEMDEEKIEIVTEEYLNTLPVWDFEYVEGVILHNSVRIN